MAHCSNGFLPIGFCFVLFLVSHFLSMFFLILYGYSSPLFSQKKKFHPMVYFHWIHFLLFQKYFSNRVSVLCLIYFIFLPHPSLKFLLLFVWVMFQQLRVCLVWFGLTWLLKSSCCMVFGEYFGMKQMRVTNSHFPPTTTTIPVPIQQKYPISGQFGFFCIQFYPIIHY